MKITFFVYSIYGMGGTVRATVNTANFLVKEGYAVEIVSVKRTHDNPLFDIDYNVKLSWLFDARQDGLFWKKVFRKIASYFPSRLIDSTEDLYKHFNLFIDRLIIRRMRKITEGAVITTIPSFNMAQVKYVPNQVIKIGQEHKDFVVHDVILQQKIKETYHGLDALVCLTEKEKERYQSFLPESVVVARIANAIQGSTERSDLSNKIIISAGRFEHEKGYDLLIEAFEKVVSEFPDWQLKMFGRGFAEQKLRDMIKEKGLTEQILIRPITKNIQSKMAQASLYVMSSRNEAFGLSIIEAMEVGLPIVSFACIGPKEIIEHGKEGLLVSEENVDELASAIKEMINSTEQLSQCSEYAMKKSKMYCSTIIAKDWQKLLTDLSG